MAQSKSDLLKEIKKLQQEILELEKRSASLTQDEIKAQEKLKNTIVRKAREVKKINQEQQKAQKDLISAVGEQESGLKSLTGIYAPIKEIEKQRVKALGESNIRSQHNVDVLGRAQAINEKIANLTSDDIVQRQALNMELEQELGSLRGRGAALDYQKSLLIESNALANQYAGLTDKQKQFLEKQLAVYDGIKDTIGGILDTARLLTSTTSGFVGALAIGAGAAGKQLLSTQRELGGELLSNQNIATTVFSKIFPDAVTTTKSLSKEFGGLNDVSLQTQFRTNILSKNLGISAGEAASLTGSFARLNEGSAKTAQDLIVSTKELAQQNGLVPADVMADVANSAEAFALFGKDGGKNIAEAAVAAGKLGVSMDKITGVADQLLDFESSINAELELGAMLGKNINLDRARALAYEGDIGGAVKATLSELGGIEEFNKMDYFQKKQTAALLGVSVDEFQKMATNADKLNKDGSIQVSQYDRMKETLKGMGEQAFSLLQGFGSSAIALGQMGVNVKGIGSSMKGIVSGIGQKFMGLFGKDALSKARKSGLSDKQIGAGFGGKKAKDMLASKTAKVPQTSVTDKVNQTTGGKGMKVGNVLKGAAAILILSAALFVAAKAFQEFGDVTWPAVGMGLAGLAGMAAIAYVLGKAQGEMIKGALAVAILGAALIPFAFSMSLIAGLDIGSVLAAAAGLVIFSAAIFGLGALMMSGVGALVFGAGLVAISGLGVSMMALGAGLIVAAAGFQAIGGSMGSVVSLIAQVKDVLGGMFMYIAPIAALSLALVGLAGALTLVGVAGIAALPGLMAVAAVGTMAIGLNSLFGGGDEGGAGGDSDLLSEIRGLREDLNTGKVAVYLDGQKVTAGVSRVVSRVGSNSYAT